MVLDFEGEANPAHSFEVTAHLFIRIGREGSFEVLFDHLSDFRAGYIGQADGRISWDHIPQIVQCNRPRRHRRPVTQAVGEGELRTGNLGYALETNIVHRDDATASGRDRVGQERSLTGTAVALKK